MINECIYEATKKKETKLRVWVSLQQTKHINTLMHFSSYFVFTEMIKSMSFPYSITVNKKNIEWKLLPRLGYIINRVSYFLHPLSFFLLTGRHHSCIISPLVQSMAYTSAILIVSPIIYIYLFISFLWHS